MPSSVYHDDATHVLLHKLHKLFDRICDGTTPTFSPCACKPRALRVAQAIPLDLQLDSEPVRSIGARLEDELWGHLLEGVFSSQRFLSL